MRPHAPPHDPGLPPTSTLRLRDGRTLAWTEEGDPAGRLVLAFHGLPGSRFQRHPDEGIARSLGARVLHLDRPGFGGSTPRPGRSLSDWADDVAELADALGQARFAVAGVSGGAPFALACAARLGRRVVRLALASGVGPPGSMDDSLPPLARLTFRTARRAPWLLWPALATLGSLAVRAPERYLTLVAARLGPADRRTLARPEIRAMFARDLAAAFAAGPQAMAWDLSLLARPWGLDATAVCAPAHLWHGDDDRLIPPCASQALARSLPGSTLRILPGAGHFLVLECWPEILGWLVA